MADAKRGRKHNWRLVEIFGETVARCDSCGLLGEYSTHSFGQSIGWKGSPTFGCAPTPVRTTRR